jgi:hypothetical protein
MHCILSMFCGKNICNVLQIIAMSWYSSQSFVMYEKELENVFKNIECLELGNYS